MARARKLFPIYGSALANNMLVALVHDRVVDVLSPPMSPNMTAAEFWAGRRATGNWPKRLAARLCWP